MDVGTIFFILVIAFGISFYAYCFFAAKKEDPSCFQKARFREIWEKEREDIIAFVLFFIAFSVGDCLWMAASGDLRDFGI